MTRVAAGAGRALMLGPLAVKPAYKNVGIGHQAGEDRGRGSGEGGRRRCHPGRRRAFYGPLGFKRIPRGQVSMPRPVDLARVLAYELKPGAVALIQGMIDHEDQLRVTA